MKREVYKPKLENIRLFNDGKLYLLIKKRPLLENSNQEYLHNILIDFLEESLLKSDNGFIEMDVPLEDGPSYIFDRGLNYDIHIFNTEKGYIHLIIDVSQQVLNELMKNIKKYFEVENEKSKN